MAHDFEQSAWAEGVWAWAGGQLPKRGIVGVVDWKAFQVEDPHGPRPYVRHIGSDEHSRRVEFLR